MHSMSVIKTETVINLDFKWLLLNLSPQATKETG